MPEMCLSEAVVTHRSQVHGICPGSRLLNLHIYFKFSSPQLLHGVGTGEH